MAAKTNIIGGVLRAGMKGQSVNVTKWEILIPVILVVLSVLSWLPRTEGPIELRWDGGTYYVLGTALAEGKGYRLLSEPGEILATQYPPMLSAIVAVHQRILGTSDPEIIARWLRLTFFVIFTAYILAVYYLLRMYLPLQFAFLGTLICLLHLMTHFLSDACLPEIPFALASVAFVTLSATSFSRGHPILTGLLATAAYLLRTAGIALFVAWIAESLVKKDFKRASLRLAIAFVPVLAWQGYIAIVEAGPSYTMPAYAYQRADYMFYNTSYARNVSLRDPYSPEKGKVTLSEIVDRFLGNLVQMPVTLGEAVSANMGYWNKWLKEIPGFKQLPSLITIYAGPGLLGILVLGGIVVQLARGQPLIPFFILAYVAAVCLAPWPIQWPRYMAPLVPFLALSLMVCLLTIRRSLLSISTGHWRFLAHGLTIGILVILFTVQSLTLVNFYTENHPEVDHVNRSGQHAKYPLFYEDVNQTLNHGLDWVRLHSNTNDVLVASMPHWSHLRTGLKTVMPPFERDPEKTQELLDSVPVRFVLVEMSTVSACTNGFCSGDYAVQYTLPLLKNRPDRWSLVHTTSNDGLQIYERIHREGF